MVGWEGAPSAGRSRQVGERDKAWEAAVGMAVWVTAAAGIRLSHVASKGWGPRSAEAESRGSQSPSPRNRCWMRQQTTSPRGPPSCG